MVEAHEWQVKNPGASCSPNRNTSRANVTFVVARSPQCQDLRKHAQHIDAGTAAERVEALVDFADACMTKAKSEMKTIRGAIGRGKYVARGYKPQRQYLALRAVAERNSPSADLEALLALRALPGAVLGRRELFDEMCNALRAHAAGDTESEGFV